MKDEVKNNSKYIAMLTDRELEEFAESLDNCFFDGHRNFMEQSVACFIFNDTIHF